MRITCHDIAGFLENLNTCGDVFGKVVYVDVSRRPLGDDPRKAMKHQVTIQTSAVLGLGDGEALLVAGEDCGADYADQGGDQGGSDRAAELKAIIVRCCEGRGLVVRPGVVSE